VSRSSLIFISLLQNPPLTPIVLEGTFPHGGVFKIKTNKESNMPVNPFRKYTSQADQSHTSESGYCELPVSCPTVRVNQSANSELQKEAFEIQKTLKAMRESTTCPKSRALLEETIAKVSTYTHTPGDVVDPQTLQQTMVEVQDSNRAIADEENEPKESSLEKTAKEEEGPFLGVFNFNNFFSLGDGSSRGGRGL